MIKRFIKTGFGGLSNSALSTLAARILSMMTANSAFPTPLPTLLVIQGLLTTYNDALAAYGITPGNRGTSAQKLALDVARTDLENALILLAAYCENVAGFDGSVLITGGWDIRATPNPVGIIGPVRDLVAISNDEVTFGQVQLDWKRPLGVSTSNVNAYNVFRGTTSNFSTAVFVKSVPRTRFLDTGLSATFYYYWIIPVGSAGDGTISDVCLANVKLMP